MNRVKRTKTQVGCIALGLLIALSARDATAQAASEFENPPTLHVKDLVSAPLLKGKGFRVEQKVPTDGVMGTYTITADKATFGEDAGVYQVRSRELLELRLAEVPAIVQLNDTSKLGTFAKAMGHSAVRPLEATGHMVMNPIDTVTGLPGGVGRLFDRVGTGAGHLWDSATDSSKGGLERTGEVATRTGSITKDMLGYEQERRELAKKLGVDPYTSNPILAKKLDEFASAAFYGRVGVNTAISVAAPASMLITGVKAVDNLVWDTPRGDLIVRVDTKLQEIKVPPGQASLFTRNAALPLSLQVAVVENLSRLPEIPGRADVVGLLGSVTTESQARFLATTVQMLADYHEKKKPLAAIAAPGLVIARDHEGTLVLPAPVDYVSWTERVSSFAKNPEFLAIPQRTLWITGKMSPRAKQELEAAGWTLHEGIEI
ncbi:MAG: hypothetical protein AB7G75_06995 [Candidatus Binatia bacterium]